jgi:hypothetical protein
MQNAAPLVQTAHLTPVTSQPDSGVRRPCRRSDVPAEPAKLAAAPQPIRIADLPKPETHLAAVDLTPAPACKAIRLARFRVQTATARLQLEQARMHLILQQLPESAAIDARVRDAVAKAEAGEEIRQIVVVSAPATL